MSHNYPIAETAKQAIGGGVDTARTRYEAEEKVPGQAIICLETEWLNLSPTDADALRAEAEQGPGHGFIQYYEDGDGQPVLAVTFWKLGKQKKAPPPPPKPVADNDHTDDLYFKSAKAKRQAKKRAPDPNQMDLFGKKKG